MFALSLTPGRPLDLHGTPGVHKVTATETPTTVEVKVALDHESAIGAVVQAVVASGAKILNLTKVEPTLEDVFLELVGRRLTEPAVAV